MHQRSRGQGSANAGIVITQSDMKLISLLALVAALLIGCSKAPEKQAAKQPSRIPTTAAAVERVTATSQVMAYYFHGTIRCETCLKIEKQAREVMERQFQSEILEKKLVFKPVNYDKPENAHFKTAYKLPCPSLVLVWQKAGKDQDWKLLGKTWDFVQVPPQLDQYIEEETRKFLEPPK